MKSSTRIFIGIIAAIVILLGVSGYVWFTNSRKPASQNASQFITEIDPKLTTEERNIYETRLTDINQKLAAAKTNDEKFNLYMQQGFNLYGLGKLSQAKDSYLKAMELDPANYNPFVALFSVQVDMRDLQGALGSIQKAATINPTSADIWKKYIQLEQGKLNADKIQINDLYIQALDKTHGNTDIITTYAQYLEDIGDLNKSVEYWQKAILAYPQRKDLFQAEIDRLQKLLKPPK